MATLCHQDLCIECSPALLVFFFLSRESRRKTPVAVALKENERLFGDSALGMVRVHLASYASCSSCTQEGVFPQLGPS